MKECGRGQFVQFHKLKMYKRKKSLFSKKKKKRSSNIIHIFKESILLVHITGFFKNPFTEILRWLVLCCFDSARTYFVHIEMSPLPVKFNPRLQRGGGGVFNVLWPRTSVCWVFFNDKTTGTQQGTETEIRIHTRDF